MNRKGFTIIELLAVIAIVGVLVLLAAPSLLGQSKKARESAIKNDVKVAKVEFAEAFLDDDDFFLKKKEVYLPTSAELMNERGKVDFSKVSGPLFEITDLVDSNLKGSFLVNQGGEVFYYNQKIKSNDKDRGDQIPELTENIKENFVILDYKNPSGGYQKNGLIEGFFKVKGVKTGVYNYNVNMTDNDGNVLSISKDFSINEGEVRVVPYSYQLKGTELVGYYDYYAYLGEKNKDSGKTLAEHEISLDKAFYVGIDELIYYHHKNPSQITKGRESVIGAGIVTPNNVRFDSDDTRKFALVISEDQKTTAMAGVTLENYYGSYEASMKLPEQTGLLNGFFMNTVVDGNVYEIDMEMMKIVENGNSHWELWMSIHDENHPNYVYGAYLEDYDPSIEYSPEGDKNYAEPGIVYQKKINLDSLLGKDNAQKDFNNYKINYYKNYISFEVNGQEVGRWNDSIGFRKMELWTSTFWAKWLPKGTEGSWEEDLDVKWIRKSYK